MRKLVTKILENVREARDGGWAQGVPDDFKQRRPTHNPTAYGSRYTIQIHDNGGSEVSWAVYKDDQEVDKGNNYAALVDFLNELSGTGGPGDDEGGVPPHMPIAIATRADDRRVSRKDPSQSYTRCPNCSPSKCRRSCPNYKARDRESDDYYRHKGAGGSKGSKW